MINFLNKGGINTKDADATSDDIINPKTAYVNGEKIVGGIIPSYSESNSNVVLSNAKLSHTNNMTMGFSLDNKYAFLIDYDTQEIVVYDNTDIELKELKRELLSNIMKQSSSVLYDSLNAITVSNYGASGNNECVYVSVTLRKGTSFITTLHIPTLTFNYKINDYLGIWNGNGNLVIFSNTNPNYFLYILILRFA